MKKPAAKAVTWDWQYIQSVNNNTACYELSTRDVVFLMSIFRQAQWETRWINKPEDFDSVEEFVVEVLYKILTPVDCNPDPDLIETRTEFIDKIHTIYEEVTDEMPALNIEFIDNQPFLEMDCGCGVRKYFALTESTVNPQTGAISNPLDTVPSYIGNVELTPTQQADCYADKVADTVIDALSAYTLAVFDFALLGVAAFFPVTTAAIIGSIEIIQAVDAALNGNLTLDFSNVGYTSGEVVTAFNSPEFRQFIIDRIGSDQQISRFALEFVALRLLNRSDLNLPTPVYPVFVAWMRMANIAALNQQLQLAATECATGNSVPTTSNFEVISSGGTEYLLYSFPDVPLATEGETYLFPEMLGDLLCYYNRLEHTANPSANPNYTRTSIVSIANEIAFTENAGGFQATITAYATSRDNTNQFTIMQNALGLANPNVSNVNALIPTGDGTAEILLKNVAPGGSITACVSHFLRTKP